MRVIRIDQEHGEVETLSTHYTSHDEEREARYNRKMARIRKKRIPILAQRAAKGLPLFEEDDK